MTEPVALVALKCLRCDTPVPAQPEEVAWACANCGQGLLLDADRGLTPQEVHYAAGLNPDAAGRPFWVADGKVIIGRVTYGRPGGSKSESERFWQAGRRFYIPAFTCPLDSLIDLGASLLQRPPPGDPGPPAPFLPVTLSPQDVPALVEFIVMAVEAERKDRLKELAISLELGIPELWVLP